MMKPQAVQEPFENTGPGSLLLEGNRHKGERDQGECRKRKEKSRAMLRRGSGPATSSTEVLKDSSYKV